MDSFAKLAIGGSVASLAAAGGYSVHRILRNRKYQIMLENKEQIKELVKHQLRLGTALSDIKKTLIHAGHNEQLVGEVVGMLDLYRYVYQNMKGGYNSVQVKHSLLHWGWDEAKVNKAVVHASHSILAQRYSSRHVTV